MLQAAIALDNRNPLARFELSGVLMAQERLQEALKEVQELAVSSQTQLQGLRSSTCSSALREKCVSAHSCPNCSQLQPTSRAVNRRLLALQLIQ